MKHSNTATAPTKRNTAGQPGAERARRIAQALSVAHLAGLPTGPAAAARKAEPLKPKPTTAARPAPSVRAALSRPAPAAMPAPARKAAPTVHSFGHLAGALIDGPLLARVPTASAPMPATASRPDWHAAAASWAAAFDGARARRLIA